MSLQGPRLRGSFEALGSSVTARAVLAVLASAAIVAASLNLSGNLTVGGTSTLGSVSASSVDVSGDVSASGYLWTGTGVKFDFVGGSGPELFKHASCSSVSAPPGSVCMRTGAGSGALFINTSATDPGAVWAEVGGSVPTFGGASGVLNVSASHTSTGNFQSVPLDTERFDTSGFHDNVTNNHLFTVPSGLGGYYHVGCNVNWDVSSSNNRQVLVVKGSTANCASGTALCHVVDLDTASGNAQMCSSIINLAAGDSVQCCTFQNSGGAVGYEGGEVWMYRVGA